MTGPEDRPADSTTGRRRFVTVLFSDLSDSTGLGQRLDAEVYAELLAAFRGRCHAVMSRHGGRIARIQGDGLLALFGYPDAAEDDGRRATEAALELHAAVAALSAEGVDAGALAMHSGIHSGLVFIADGDVERGRFEVLGNVPNTAARLCSAAGRGEILVSDASLGPQAHFFVLGECIKVPLKGQAPDLPAYRVHGRANVQRRFEAHRLRGFAPFVGRGAEFARLRAHLQAPLEGEPRWIVLAGGPGLGKTRLLEEALSEVAGSERRVLRGYCESYLSAEPMQPFMQMLRSLCGIDPARPAGEVRRDPRQVLDRLDGLSEETRRELLGMLGVPDADGRRGGAGAMAAWLELLEAVARQRPLVLAIDDLQWADDKTQQLLLALRGKRLPICVLMTLRPDAEELPASLADQTMVLTPWTLEQTRQTVDELVGEADPFLAEAIHHHSGGNPLFVEELCHSAAADRSSLLDPRHGSQAWLSALIVSRMDRLPQDQGQLLRTASVIGAVFPAWLLARVSERAADDPTLVALSREDFLFPAEQPGMLRFKHGITREVVYDTVGLHERRALHRRIAAELESSGQEEAWEALSFHHAAGGQNAQAARYAERAGDKAMAAMALDRARVQFRAALSALDAAGPLSPQDKSRWCSIAQKLGMASVFDPIDLADGTALFERSVSLARETGDPATVARCEYWLGYVAYSIGRAPAATPHCEAALELASRIGDERLAAQVSATLAQVLISSSRYDRAAPLLDAALDIKKRQARPGSSVAIGSAYALAAKGSMLGDQGDFALADECFLEALALLGQSPHQVGSSVRGLVAATWLWQGRWSDAQRIAEEGARIAELGRSRQLLAMSRALGAYARWRQGAGAAALDDIRDATGWIEARRGAFMTSLNYGWLVEGAIAEGRMGEARRHAARLFRRARQDDRLGEAMGCRALAIAAAEAGDPARAQHCLAQAQRAARARKSRHEEAVNELCRARLARAAGDMGSARRAADDAMQRFEAMAMLAHAAEAERLLGQL